MKSENQRVREIIRRARPYAMLAIGLVIAWFSIVTDAVPVSVALALLAIGLLTTGWATVLHYERIESAKPERSLRRVREVVRWLRPYVTFIIGALFVYVGIVHWWNDDVQPYAITPILWAIGLLIMGRANTLYRERASR
jgi:hypothetical protein